MIAVVLGAVLVCFLLQGINSVTNDNIHHVIDSRLYKYRRDQRKALTHIMLQAEEITNLRALVRSINLLRPR